VSEIIVERDVPVPMRDGVTLVADVYRSSSGPQPVLLARTPYNKTSLMMEGMIRPLWLASHGYTVVIQDSRGRYGSEGVWEPFLCEIEDGYDTVEWCAQQSWSDGNVGMCGASYVGATQWLAAISAPPSLRCIFPIVTAAEYHDGWVYQGGAFNLGFIGGWTAEVLSAPHLVRLGLSEEEHKAEEQKLLGAVRRLRATLSHRPLNELPLFKREHLAPFIYDWFDRPPSDDFWQSVSIKAHHDRVTVPAYSVGGWYDLFLAGPPRNFEGLRKSAATERARNGQHLLMGPWPHSVNAAVVGERVFGPDATYPIEQTQLRWFAHWLKGSGDEPFDDPPVRIYVMNKGWREEQEWPLARTQYTSYYLHSNGRAQSRHGDGTLTTDPPTSDEEPDVYLFNPRSPVGGSAVGGVLNQAELELRTDVLVYTSAPLTEAVEVTGPVKLVLHASTSTPDTDWCAKLVDVAPDGYAANICDGILRARYRDGFEEAHLLEPGVSTEFEVDMLVTSNLFLPGHRIRLEVSSSNFPKFDCNGNTEEPVVEQRIPVPAVQTVFHSADCPSHLVLPVIPASAAS
jgi:putative CocE/NonD family hydrolase